MIEAGAAARRANGRGHMASFFKQILGKLVGGSAAGSGAEPAGEAVEYNGYLIRATPFSEGGQYQTSGVIEKVFDSETKSHRFIRAEKHPSREDAEAFSITKGKQIVDEQGDRIFG
jgi:hypothetical protein